MTADINASLVEGLYLMLVGMSFVLGFLTLVVISLRVLAALAPAEDVVPAEKRTANVMDKTKLAVISAAVHQYRSENQN